MTLEEIKIWLSTQVKAPAFFSGQIDSSFDNCIGVHNGSGPKPNIAIGGIQNTTYVVKSIIILIHWGKNSNAAELKAQEIYDALFGKTAIIGTQRVINFDMKMSQPLSLGTDNNGIFEYVIHVNITYER
ncbi:MAG: hypothetical protein K0S61_4001 [Anaerocolumna sp.]|jgi:hypothetical protein|nr:hypothetical protein [Anaerocolumna sp.]